MGRTSPPGSMRSVQGRSIERGIRGVRSRQRSVTGQHRQKAKQGGCIRLAPGPVQSRAGARSVLGRSFQVRNRRSPQVHLINPPDRCGPGWRTGNLEASLDPAASCSGLGMRRLCCLSGSRSASPGVAAGMLAASRLSCQTASMNAPRLLRTRLSGPMSRAVITTSGTASANLLPRVWKG